MAATSGMVSPLTGYSLSWTVSASELEVTIVAATIGWVGLGLASSGGMHGADIMIASVDDSTGVGSIGDYYSVSQAMPVLDEQQDWTLVSAAQSEGTTTITARRALDTSDQQDWKISSSSPTGQQLIIAMGSTDALSQHAPTQRIGFRANLFRPEDDLSDHMASVRAVAGVQSFNLTTRGYVGAGYVLPLVISARCDAHKL